MRYFHAVLSKFACAISIFQKKNLFCVHVPLARRWEVADVFHAGCVILTMSVYSLVIAREYGKGIRDAQSRNEKWIYFMLSNNKLLGKCWYGGHPWILLAIESERMVEKGIKFIFCLGTAYDISSMGSVGNYSVVFCWQEKYASQNVFISQFSLWALAPLQIPTSLYEGPFFYFMQFLFLLESPSSLIKQQLRGTMIILEHWV